MCAPKFASGVIRFQKEIFPAKKALFETLSHGQSPEALFITCSDSRIETPMITQAEPGELFICRTAGNFVPPHAYQTGGMAASIEYATAVLKVPHIVICGHKECGALKAALNPEGAKDLPHMQEWLSMVKEAVDLVKENCADKSEAECAQMLVEQNVVLQIEHIKTYPTVASRLERGELELHGWVYDIKTGDVDAYDAQSRRFIPVAEYYSGRTA